MTSKMSAFVLLKHPPVPYSPWKQCNAFHGDLFSNSMEYIATVCHVFPGYLEKEKEIYN